jgi:hypothetical protein
LTFWGGDIGVTMKDFRHRRTPEEMDRLVSLLRGMSGTAETLDDAVAKEYRTFCIFSAERVLATDEDLGALSASSTRRRYAPRKALTRV